MQKVNAYIPAVHSQNRALYLHATSALGLGSPLHAICHPGGDCGCSGAALGERSVRVRGEAGVLGTARWRIDHRRKVHGAHGVGKRPQMDGAASGGEEKRHSRVRAMPR